MKTENKRLEKRFIIIIIMSVLLTAAIVYASLMHGGSERNILRVSDRIWEYIDSTYTDINVKNHGEKPVFTGDFSYSLLVSDSDCEDICFYVFYTNGNITDDYYYRVTKKINTLLRLEEEMGEYYKDILTVSESDISDVQITLPPRAKNDIPDSIYIGVEFDPTHPIYRGSTLTLVCKATYDMEHISALIKEAHAAAEEVGTVFSEYCVYGVESDEAFSLEIDGVTPDAAESEKLSELLAELLNGESYTSTSDISVSIYG